LRTQLVQKPLARVLPQYAQFHAQFSTVPFSKKNMDRYGCGCGSVRQWVCAVRSDRVVPSAGLLRPEGCGQACERCAWWCGLDDLAAVNRKL
jgi:hypothetical protein